MLNFALWKGWAYLALIVAVRGWISHSEQLSTLVDRWRCRRVVSGGRLVGWRLGPPSDNGPMSDRPPPPEFKHVWVTAVDGRHAGLLLEWAKRTEHGVWEGRVVHARWRAGEWQVGDEWLPASMLTPVD